MEGTELSATNPGSSSSISSDAVEPASNSASQGFYRDIEVPAEARETYILSGYRPVENDLSTCIRSAFTLHNETLNVWTHALPLLYFLYFGWLDAEFWIDSDLRQGGPGDRVYPLYGYVVGICILFATSAGAHLLSCASWRWRNVCFMMDYAAISLYGISAANAYYYYNDTNSWLLVLCGETVFLLFIMMSATVATGACCWTRIYSSNSPVSNLVRTTAFSLPFLVGSFPVVSRFLESCSWPESAGQLAHLPLLTYTLVFGNNATASSSKEETSDDDEAVFRTRYIRHFGFLAIGVLVNVSKVPERWRPGMFDVIGHSHQWFHVFIFLGLREQFWLMVADATKGHDQRAQEVTPLAGLTSLGMLLFSISILLATVVTFSVLMKGATAGKGSSSRRQPATKHDTLPQQLPAVKRD